MTKAERIERLWAYEARWPLPTRQEYQLTHPQNFAGPALALPIKTLDDIKDAEVLLDQALEEEKPKVKARIVEIATSLDLAHALPPSWKEAKIA